MRALLVDLRGKELCTAVVPYRHGQITESHPATDEQLPPDYAFQHPQDWLESMIEVVKIVCAKIGLSGETIISIGVDFTSCTMLPTRRDGTPLCLIDEWSAHLFAWPRLWKHHGAKSQTDRLNDIAQKRNEPWLSRYGGIIGLEWFFPKILEAIEKDPIVADATDVWLEAGDWLVWQLVASDAAQLPRSTCQAGYKAMWSRANGYPSEEFFAEVHPKLVEVLRTKLPGEFYAPGTSVGGLCKQMADALGLREGIPISSAIIDAHAGVPGAGAADEGTLVMVLGTSSCHMLNARLEKHIPGVAGVVEDGILPGFFGYETGQAAVGDAFDWLRRLVGHDDFAQLDVEAAALPPGAEGVLCLDWFNGCRTPLMDGHLRGGFTGMTLNHGPAHAYRALLEASAFGLRWIVELLQHGGVPVEHFVATGGLPHHNPMLIQIYADVLGEIIQIHSTKQGPALGAAILGVVAAGESITGFSDATHAIQSMTSSSLEITSPLITPNLETTSAYDRIYSQYRRLAEFLEAEQSQR